MKGTELGELEELVMLTVAVLYDDAYGVSVMKEIKKRANRSIALSTVHVVLKRLEGKGFLKTLYDQPNEKREGRRKLLYQVTSAGESALAKNRELRNAIWQDITNLATRNG